MNETLLQTSIVVVGEGFSSMSARPEVLQRLGVLPPSWILSQNVLVTPIVTVLTFTNGVELLQETNRFQIRAPITEVSHTALAEIVIKYLSSANPLVPCSAVGVNFDGFGSQVFPEEYLADRLTNRMAWPFTESGARVIGTRYRFDRDTEELHLSLEVAERQNIPGIGISANFHTSVKSEASSEEITQAIGRVKRHADYLVRLIEAFSENGTRETS